MLQSSSGSSYSFDSVLKLPEESRERAWHANSREGVRAVFREYFDEAMRRRSLADQVSIVMPGLVSGSRPNSHAVFARAERSVHLTEQANFVTVASVAGVTSASLK